MASLSYAAACFGWRIELCSEAGDADIAAWLGLDRNDDFVLEEHETPDLICRLHTNRDNGAPMDFEVFSQISKTAQWSGKADRLSSRHFYRWPVINEVSVCAEKPSTVPERLEFPAHSLPEPANNLVASRLIRQRRSAQHFNGKAGLMPLADFYRILAALLSSTKPPFTAWNWPPQVHVFLFVHRVASLEPGLYLLPRDAKAVPDLKTAFSADFNWQPVAAPFSFFQLTAGNVRQAARTLSCHQPIAGDSAFSLGMLAHFADNVETAAWSYRRLFWECGLLGQILYLEAEAAGVRGTGIGCFFDDAVHGVLGLKDNQWQSLYHFTVGVPLEDARLQSLPAYEHL